MESLRRFVKSEYVSSEFNRIQGSIIIHDRAIDKLNDTYARMWISQTFSDGMKRTHLEHGIIARNQAEAAEATPR